MTASGSINITFWRPIRDPDRKQLLLEYFNARLTDNNGNSGKCRIERDRFRGTLKASENGIELGTLVEQYRGESGGLRLAVRFKRDFTPVK